MQEIIYGDDGNDKQDFGKSETAFPDAKIKKYFPKVNPEVFEKTFPDTTLYESANSYYQLAWLDECFQLADKAGKSYDYYVRLRPDMFWMDPLPDINSLEKDVLYTSTKIDAPMSDQFMLFSREIYTTWWKPVIRKHLTDGFPLKDKWTICCPEFFLFDEYKGKKQQLETTRTCLARNETYCQCWHEECLDEEEGIFKEFPNDIYKLAVAEAKR